MASDYIKTNMQCSNSRSASLPKEIEISTALIGDVTDQSGRYWETRITTSYDSFMIEVPPKNFGIDYPLFAEDPELGTANHYDVIGRLQRLGYATTHHHDDILYETMREETAMARNLRRLDKAAPRKQLSWEEMLSDIHGL